MGYIASNLMADEQLIFITRLHWANFLGAVYMLQVGFIFGDLWWLLFGIGVLMGVHAMMNFAITEFGVTNKRVMAKTGFLRPRSLEMLLNHVESISVDQGFLGRFLGYGTIVVGGQGGIAERFPGIAQPFVLERYVNEQIEAAR